MIQKAINESLRAICITLPAWLADPFMQVKSTRQNSTHISNWRAQADLKMYILYKDIYKCINFFFKNVIFLSIEYKIYIKILQKLHHLVEFQNRPSTVKKTSNSSFVHQNELSILSNFPSHLRLFMVYF